MEIFMTTKWLIGSNGRERSYLYGWKFDNVFNFVQFFVFMLNDNT